ncbi:MAG TPA: glycosyltransferase [Ramlibacter sp.]|nr:glycosyltransferase [Ramlibacter sp.]
MKPLPKTPLVSIVTPSFNTGRFIEETLRSVRQQGYPRVEHIVLDSESTDETPEVLARFPSVRLIRPAPAGLTEKTNLGFSIAKGDIVAWLCADDYLLPDAIAKAVEALQKNPDAALVYCNFMHVDEHSKELDRPRSKQAGFRDLVEEHCWVPSQTAFMRREALERVGPVSAGYMHVADWDLYIRISKNFPILYIDDWWAASRVRKGQLADVHKYTFWIQARKMTRGYGARFFSPLFWDFWRGKFSRASLLLLRGQFRAFKSKLHDFLVGFVVRLGRH